MFVAPSLFDPSILSAPVAAEVRNVSAKTLQMRPYQVKAHAAVYAALQHHRRVLVVSGTGTGKTVVLSHIIDNWPEDGGRILILAHRKELIDQAKAKVEKVTGAYAAIEMAAHRADRHGQEHRVVVGSIQTQISGAGGEDKTKLRMQRFNPLDFGLIIVDEAHRAISVSFQKTINYYLNGNPNAKLIGFTATPDRADKQAMGKVFEHVAFVYPMLDAINDGWIVAPRVQTVRVTGLDFSKIRTTAGDLNCADLERVLMYEKPLHGMAEPAMKLAAGRQTLVFCAGVGHAERLSEIFNRHNPGCSRVVHGKTPREHRRYIFDAFGRKEFQILCNVGIVTEGTDLPGIEVIILARPTKSRALFEQMLGRGVRPAAEIAEPLNLVEEADRRRLMIAQSVKPFFAVIDFTGVAGRHKLITVADILGGNYDEPVRERAAKLAADRTAKGGNDLPADVMDDLEEAQRQIDAERRERDRLAAVERENRRHLIAKTEYVTKNVNVFDFYEVDVPVQSTFTHAEPPSERMVKALERHNIDASRLTKGQAGELIGKLVGRLTVPQAKLLLRQGWGEKDINKLTIHEASKLIDVTKTMGKRPRALSAESLVSGKNPWDAVPM